MCEAVQVGEKGIRIEYLLPMKEIDVERLANEVKKVKAEVEVAKDGGDQPVVLVYVDGDYQHAIEKLTAALGDCDNITLSYQKKEIEDGMSFYKGK